MQLKTFLALRKEFEDLRTKFEPIFCAETSLGKFNEQIPSTGHCAVVAANIYILYQGKLVSIMIDGVSHWFNRIEIDRNTFDIDLTGDQFGMDKVQIMFENELYPNTRIRKSTELNNETLKRIKLFATRAGIDINEFF